MINRTLIVSSVFKWFGNRKNNDYDTLVWSILRSITAKKPQSKTQI